MPRRDLLPIIGPAPSIAQSPAAAARHQAITTFDALPCQDKPQVKFIVSLNAKAFVVAALAIEKFSSVKGGLMVQEVSGSYTPQLWPIDAPVCVKGTPRDHGCLSPAKKHAEFRQHGLTGQSVVGPQKIHPFADCQPHSLVHGLEDAMIRLGNNPTTRTQRLR